MVLVLERNSIGETVLLVGQGGIKVFRGRRSLVARGWVGGAGTVEFGAMSVVGPLITWER